MHIAARYPHKFNIDRNSGSLWGIELCPQLSQTKPAFFNPDAAPFRFTPNLQTLLGPLVTEGVYAPAIMAIARSLASTSSYALPVTNGNSAAANGSSGSASSSTANGTNTSGGQASAAAASLPSTFAATESDLETHLSIFVRDEVIVWFTQQHKNISGESSVLRDTVSANTDIVVRRARSLAEPGQNGLPAHQTVIDLIARVTRPTALAGGEALWMGYL